MYRQISTSIDKFGKSRRIWTSLDKVEHVNLDKIVEGIILNDVFQFWYDCFQVLSENHEWRKKMKKD